eukprot:scaffold238563_cov31-Tisochrysis_lutea.AAC.5
MSLSHIRWNVTSAMAIGRAICAQLSRRVRAVKVRVPPCMPIGGAGPWMWMLLAPHEGSRESFHGDQS